MRRTTTAFSCLLGLLLAWPSFCPAADAQPGYADPPTPAYRVNSEGFKASDRDIKAVCDSAARELWRYFPDYDIEPFVVARGKNGPIVLFNRNDDGEIVMRLDTENTFWCQYAYQFAHEFCHILCGYDDDYAGNKWFEETICETASLFAMRAMASVWAKDPPYPHWKDYRDALRNYTDDVIAKRRGVYEIYEKGLPDFYWEHQEELRENAGLRELNGAMSILMLRLFEEDPRRWEAVRWLNSVPSPQGETFPQYLQRWHDAVPDRHQAFVKTIADFYRVPIDSTARPDAVVSAPEVHRPTGSAVPTKSNEYARPPMPDYRVVAEGFQASERDIKAVCDSAGRELWRFFPECDIEPIVVQRGDGGPVVLYQRNSKGEIVVKLDTEKTFWCQYAYQFSYLFANVLCGFDEKSVGNRWFEVSLCETASLFALRAMVRAWEHDPPYAHWKDYRHSIQEYAQNAIEGREQLAPEKLHDFYRQHEKELAAGTNPRPICNAMAVVLLKVFEEQPEHWEVVRWINQSPSPKGEPFPKYLRRWHDAVPDRHKPFVRRIAELYGEEIDPPKAD